MNAEEIEKLKNLKEGHKIFFPVKSGGFVMEYTHQGNGIFVSEDGSYFNPNKNLIVFYSKDEALLNLYQSQIKSIRSEIKISEYKLKKMKKAENDIIERFKHLKEIYPEEFL